MKKLERILLYLVLAVIIIYVFLIDSKVESKADIYEEIRVRNLIVVDSQGREAVRLTADKNGGAIHFYNKAGGNPMGMTIDDDGYGMIIIYDATGFHVY